MARQLAPGDVIGGFRLEQKFHHGGMGTLWTVSRADIATPLVMKLPFLLPGEDPLTIVSYETEQMILPRLSGSHVPAFIAAGDFDGPYVVMELIAGRSLRDRLPELPLPIADVADLGARIADRAGGYSSPARHPSRCQAEQHHDPRGRRRQRRSGAARLRSRPASRSARSSRRRARRPDRHRRLYRAGAIARHSQRPAQRSIRARRAVVFLRHRHAAVRRAAHRRPVAQAADPRDRCRRAACGRICRHGSRKSSCIASKSIRAERYQSAAHLAFDLRHPELVRLSARAERSAGAAACSPRYRAGCARPMPASPLRRSRSRSARRHRSSSPPSISVRRTRADASLACHDRALGGRRARRPHRVRQRAQAAARRARESEDEEGRNLHLLRLAALKHWAAPLARLPNQLTYHVIEAIDPAAALIEFARRNHVRHLITGARASSKVRRYVGSVSAKVVAEAPCSVTVVRA